MKLTSNEIKWRDGMSYAYVYKDTGCTLVQSSEFVPSDYDVVYIVEREEKKTVVDAVNNFKGEWKIKGVNFIEHGKFGNDFNFVNYSVKESVYYICNKEEFNQCVKEMTKGSEALADYIFYKTPLTKENSDYSYYETMLRNEKGEVVGQMINKDTLEAVKELDAHIEAVRQLDETPEPDKTQVHINGLNETIKQLREALELKQCAIELLKSANKDTQELEDEWQNGDECIFNGREYLFVGINPYNKDIAIIQGSVGKPLSPFISLIAKKPKKEKRWIIVHENCMSLDSMVLYHSKQQASQTSSSGQIIEIEVNV